MGFFGTESTLESQFAPAMLFALWRNADRWPKAQRYIRQMSIPSIVDVFVKGAEEWNGKFADFIKGTTFDPALGGYPPSTDDSAPKNSIRDTTLDTNTAFDSLRTNPLRYDKFADVHGGDELGISGALGGGGDFDGVE
ncbi:hypothetical protein R3P38DRAFT_2803932 [Favolaschia claudopus]|uniref:Uncharacterized protein n=1 Tax=Favolaschia claudopus TaxID=2862362 RepID=A0AAV9ZRM2_9AGAR